MSIAPLPAPRPAQVGKRDFRLNDARLDNALRLIAEVGKFNLVIQGNLNQSVTVVLNGVEPYDALIAIAEAHGFRVHFERQIVTVSPNGPTS